MCAYPNNAEAIAWANQAAAYTGLKNHREALAASRRATKACPEYVKGHIRELRALQAGSGEAGSGKVVGRWWRGR